MPEPLSPKSGFGMNVTTRPAFFATFLHDVLVDHQLVGHLEERREAHVDLGLPRRRHLVVVRLDDDPEILHLQDHLAADVLLGVGRRDREVAFLEARLVAEVRSLVAPAVPLALDRVDEVVALVGSGRVAHVVEDEELGLRTDVGGVGDPRELQVVRRAAARSVAGRGRYGSRVIGSMMLQISDSVG